MRAPSPAACLFLIALAMHPALIRPAVAKVPIASSVMALVHADRWVEADAAAAILPDPVIRKLVTFYRMLAPGAAGVAELDAFRAANPSWPLQGLLTRRREEAIVAEPDDATAQAACERERPASAPALLRCADGNLRLGNAETAAAEARAAWIAAAPSRTWEAAFLRQWGAAIGPAEQRRRFDQLFRTSTVAAALQLPRLSAADWPEAAARLALQGDDPQAPALVAALPAASRRSPAVVLERARWLRRSGSTASAIELWLRLGAAAEREVSNADRPAFWAERNLLARQCLAHGDWADAYALASGAAQTAPEQIADARFLAGWIALRRLADPHRAIRHFEAVARVSRAAITQARAHYWLARAASAAGDDAVAQREYAAAAAYPSTFYGQLAGLAADRDPGRLHARIVATRDPGWTDAQALAFASSELIRAGVWLVAWGEPGRAAAFLLRMAETTETDQDRVLAARLATGADMPQTAVALARVAGRAGLVLLDSGWPIAARVAPGNGVDPALVLGVIRQESSFDPAVVSPAGARGLMQLMPQTAAQVAGTLGLAATLPSLSASPDLNVQLGTAYLGKLLSRFGGAVALAVAGYNAGPSRVAAWLTANGDPRTAAGVAGSIDMQDWIELIPFSETRNYVQRVIENTVIYQAKLGEAAPFPFPWQPSPA